MNRLGLFQYSGADYALPLSRLERIHQRLKSYVLPKLPVSIPAVVIDQHRLIPLLNLDILTGTGNDRARYADYYVFIESEYGTVALPADMTCGIIVEQKGTLRDSQENSMLGQVGEFDYQGRTYLLLDIDLLLFRLTQGF